MNTETARKISANVAAAVLIVTGIDLKQHNHEAAGRWLTSIGMICF